MLAVFHKSAVHAHRITICETADFSFYREFWYHSPLANVAYFLKMNMKVNKTHITTQTIHQAPQVDASDTWEKVTLAENPVIEQRKENVFISISRTNVSEDLKHVQYVPFRAVWSLWYI